MRLAQLVLLALALAASGCSAANTPPGNAASATPPVSPTSSATIDPLAAPESLQGNWRTTLAPGDIVTLIIDDRASVIQHEEGVHATISVEGDQITFTGSELCPKGKGVYRWVVEGDTLTLTSVRPDECVGRAAALDGFTFTRRF